MGTPRAWLAVYPTASHAAPSAPPLPLSVGTAAAGGADGAGGSAASSCDGSIAKESNRPSLWSSSFFTVLVVVVVVTVVVVVVVVTVLSPFSFPPRPSNHPCFNPSLLDIRLNGDKQRRDFMRLRPCRGRRWECRFSNVSGRGTRGREWELKRGLCRNSSRWCSPRVPRSFWMRLSWSSSDSPGKRAWPSAISLTMQPTAQTSTFSLYRVTPRSSSGQRYHRVAT